MVTSNDNQETYVMWQASLVRSRDLALWGRWRYYLPVLCQKAASVLNKRCGEQAFRTNSVNASSLYLHMSYIIPKQCTIFSDLGLLHNESWFHRKSCQDYRLHCKHFSTHADGELRLDSVQVLEYISAMKKKFEESSGSSDEYNHQTVRRLQPIMLLLNEVDVVNSDILELQALIEDADSDEELKNLARTDLIHAESKLLELEEKFFTQILPEEPLNNTDVTIEFSMGVGGQEAMLFCLEIFNMYQNFADYMGWESEISDYEATDIGGLRHAAMNISGNEVYKWMKYEGGIHRVQRVPKTEKGGRIHTSTVSVVVLPRPSEIEVEILDKDLKIETKRASGAGGQHVNTTDSAVRITHIPSGIAVESQIDRSQHKNKADCLQKLRTKLYQIQLESNLDQYTTNRKLQVGTRGRSEKIRTYNFPQDRVTDHRIGTSVFNLQSLLDGADTLHAFIGSLLEEADKERLLEIISRNQI